MSTLANVDRKLSVAQHLAEYVRRSPQLLALKAELEKRNLKGFVFGGLVRDLVTGRGNPRDVDVIVTGDLVDYDGLICHLRKAYEVVKQPDWRDSDADTDPERSGSDGNTTVLADGLLIDVWHIGTQRGEPRVIERVPSTTFLYLESIVALLHDDPAKVEVHDDGFLDAVRDGVVEARLCWQNDIVPRKYLAKSLALAKRLSFRVGPDLKLWLENQLRQVSVQDFVDAQVKRYDALVVDLDDVQRLMAARRVEDKFDAFWR